MSLIEKAARRLDELQRAGIDVSDAGALTARTDTGSPTTLADVVRAGRAGAAAPWADARLRGDRPGGDADRPQRRSRQVDLNLAALTAQGYLTPLASRSRLAEEVRVLKRPLLENAHGRSAAPIRRPNLIMVTSSVPGEGKTFTAINLALSMAMEVDSTVLLVDADVALPAVAERLGLPSAPGLLDLLTQPDLDVSEAIVRTNIERLSVLPAGNRHARATELLSSAAMDRLLDEMAGRYQDRIVVFDSPPLLLSAEARALAAQVGQVLVVVEADRTSETDVASALAVIENCPVVMTILNKTRPLHQGSGYYGQYSEPGA